MPNLDFGGQNTLRATHGLHAYAAKCPPQVVAHAIRYYSDPGDRLLDPMVGSGTTLVQARIMGRNALGYDFDPLACLIARVKSRQLNDRPIGDTLEIVTRRMTADLRAIKTRRVSQALRARAQPPEFPNRDYWFAPEVSTALALLGYHIHDCDAAAPVEEFFWVALSSLILAKSSVANARDIVHSRHHYWEHEHPPDVLARFDARVKRMRQQVQEFRLLCRTSESATAEARLGDARQLRLADESVDLIFTSPPYTTALDYPRAHFLAIPWLERALGISLAEYRRRAPDYIGSEQGSVPGEFIIDPALAELRLTSEVLTDMRAISIRHAKLTQRYLLDMQKVLGEMARVLRDGHYAVLVICPSHIRSVDVPTHDLLVEMSRQLGFGLKRRHVRTISPRRRVMPYMRSFGDRMSTEYVLVLQKGTGRSL